MMAFEIKSLLPAAIMSTIGGETTVSGLDLYEVVQSKWAGPYSVIDILQAVGYLSEIGDVAFLDISNPDELIRINGANLNSVLRNNSWREKAPASYNWVNFGDTWLKREWDKALAQERHVEGGSPAQDSPITGADSSTWTGLPASFVLSEGKRAKLVTLIQQVEDSLDATAIGNQEKAQARAYVIAAKALAEAPEPPVELIWEIIQRASNLSGIASLFVSIIALFAAAG